MKVCIAEKPSVAREIASILGANTKHDGYYEGNGYAVTYTFGHLCRLQEPKDYKAHWKSWDLNNLPMLPERFGTKVTEDSGIQKQFKIIKSLFNKADVVINCGDAGQEGELIQRWVIQQANYKGKIQRLWISSLTEEAIKDGFNNLKAGEEYDNLFYAGYSRAIGDWLLGLNATRLYTVKFGGHKQVLSIGRVQTPSLAMLVNRFKEIQSFKPLPYWELQTVYKDTLFACEEGRFLKKEAGKIFAAKVKEADFEIISVNKKKGKEYAPKLFDLTGLQVYCNTKFGFSADETLKIAQKLYEMKAITYPRVDTTFLPNDVFPKVAPILKKLSKYQRLIAPLLTTKIKKSTRVFNDKKVTDHHAIIPTGIQINLQEKQHKVYDIITRRFIAVFYPDSEISNTAVIGKAASVSFKTTGKEILSKGWRIVFETTKDTKKTKDNEVLPTFIKGEKGPHEPSFLEKETKPPRNYTEASLLRAMETAGKQVDDDEMRELMKENGIGRPSTRASIIETLFKRKYIKRQKKLIVPTETGIALIDLIDNELLKSAELTGLWEKRLKEIERGTYHAATFIKEMKRMVDQLVYEVRSSTKSKRISSEVTNSDTIKRHKKKTKPSVTDKICPKCKKGKVLKGSSAYGCTAYKTGCDFRLPFEIYHKKISENQILRLLNKGCTVHLKGWEVKNEKIEGLLRFDSEFNLVLEPKVSIASKKIEDYISCPKCKKGKILKGKTAYGCSAYKTGCDYILPFTKIKEITQEDTISMDFLRKIMHNN